VFEINKGTDKARKIEQPKRSLDAIHERIFYLLKHVKAPDYLYSGVKGISPIKNAKLHLGNDPLIKLDIVKFYPSTTFPHVFSFFKEIMKCDSDVAKILTKLSTYEGHIPTGSRISQIVAFYSHKPMFDELNVLSKKYDLNMSVWVDDIVFSGKKSSPEVLRKAKKIIRKNGLQSHKEHFYSEGRPKKVTGYIIDKEKICLPNNKHLDIYKTWGSIDFSESKNLKPIQSLLGKVNAAGQVDPSFKSKGALLKQLLKSIQRKNRKIA